MASQLKIQPKTPSGAYWHKNIYPNQVWLDGIFMGEPFSARYANEFNHPEKYDEILTQFVVAEKSTYEPRCGLYAHAFDESNKMFWADPNTGLSLNVWGLSLIHIFQYAKDWNYGDEFIKWVEEENHFTNTLVDRIVTGYPRETAKEMEESFGHLDNVIDTAEIFHLWVIEGDKKYAEEIPFHKIGLNVLWTDDVTPYKKRKVRILNGAHTMMVLAERLAGLETVGEAMEDELIYSFRYKGVVEEIIPTLDLPKEELVEFANAVIERFKNPFIKHYLLSIALNSVSKFKVRDLPSLLGYMDEFGKEPNCLVFSLAALIKFYKGDEANDDAAVMEYMKNASVADILAKEDFWGQDLSMLRPSVEKYCAMIDEKGIREAMKEACGL